MKPMKEYKPPHFEKRKKERRFADRGYIYVLGNFVAEYGYKATPDSEPRPLPNRNRRAFLVQGEGVKGELILIDATGDVVAMPTGMTTPLDRWGPLPDKYKNYVSAKKKK